MMSLGMSQKGMGITERCNLPTYGREQPARRLQDRRIIIEQADNGRGFSHSRNNG